MEYYFTDSDLMPLFIQENYVNCTPNVPGLATATKTEKDCHILESLSKAADSVCDGDLVSKLLWNQQLFELMPLHATFSWYVHRMNTDLPNLCHV